MNSTNVDFSWVRFRKCVQEPLDFRGFYHHCKNPIPQKTHHGRLAKEDPAQRRARRTVGSALLTSLPHFAKRLIAKYNSKDPGGWWMVERVTSLGIIIIFIIHELGISFLTTRYCRHFDIRICYHPVQAWNSSVIKQWHRYGVGCWLRATVLLSPIIRAPRQKSDRIAVLRDGHQSISRDWYLETNCDIEILMLDFPSARILRLWAGTPLWINPWEDIWAMTNTPYGLT